jgi:hypothetical protein
MCLHAGLVALALSRRKVSLLAFALTAALVVYWFGVVDNRPRPPLPIQITVMRYAAVTPGRPPPWKSGTILADLVIKNTGREAISISRCWASQPDGQIVPGGFLGTAHLLPMESYTTHIFLPGSTSNWKLNSRLKRLWTPNEYAATRVQRLKWLPKIFEPLAWHALLPFTPDPGPYLLESDSIEVVEGTNGLPRRYQLRPARSP